MWTNNYSDSRIQVSIKGAHCDGKKSFHPGTNHPTVPKEANAIVKVELATDSENQENIHFSVNGFDFCVQANVSREFLTKLLEATKHAG